MRIITHGSINRQLCGSPLQVENGYSRVELLTTPVMAADETGLVHGGFIFGLADYAAMLAVNHPHVVLGAADATFLKPVKQGEKITAEARIEEVKGKKHRVTVSVKLAEEVVFKGLFTCFVLEKHVLG